MKIITTIFPLNKLQFNHKICCFNAKLLKIMKIENKQNMHLYVVKATKTKEKKFKCVFICKKKKLYCY